MPVKTSDKQMKSNILTLANHLKQASLSEGKAEDKASPSQTKIA